MEHFLDAIHSLPPLPTRRAARPIRRAGRATRWSGRGALAGEHDAGEVERIGAGEAHAAIRRFGSADGVQRLGRLRERELLAAEAPHEPAPRDEPAILHAPQRPLEIPPAHRRVLGGDEVVEHDAPSFQELIGQGLGQLLPVDVGRRGGHEGPPPGGLGGTQPAGGPQPHPSRRGGRSVAATGGDRTHGLEAVGDQPPTRASPPTGPLRRRPAPGRSPRSSLAKHAPFTVSTSATSATAPRAGTGGHASPRWAASSHGRSARSTSDTGVVRVAPARRRSGSSGDGGRGAAR